MVDYLQDDTISETGADSDSSTTNGDVANTTKKQQNVSGKTTINSDYNKLQPTKVEALFKQEKMQFPAFDDNHMDTACANIKAKNIS